MSSFSITMKITHVLDSDYERFLILFNEAHQADSEAHQGHVSPIGYPRRCSELQGDLPMLAELPNSISTFEPPTERASIAELPADPFYCVSTVPPVIRPDIPWGSSPRDFSRG